ncbi:MAG: hypothetical protein FWB78_11720 [Treponema sp.]|nr:hypothetical protein [Treponema sp.]
MKLTEAIEIRRSRRKYLGTSIDPGIASKLRELIAEYNMVGGIRMELVLDNGEAFRGFRKSYGMFSGVNDYVALIADKDDSTAIEKLGYYGELLVLHTTAMGLGSCWVGMGGDRDFQISDNETLVCTIILGNTNEKDSLKEKLIRGIAHRKTKSAKEMSAIDGPVPGWFMQGMKAVEKAPSAMNGQPVTFSYKAGKITASVKTGSSGFAKFVSGLLDLDLGIAKLHFELGAGGGTWEWGNDGEFVRQSS